MGAVDRSTQTRGATGDIPDAAYAAALASVPGIGPKALRSLLSGAAPPVAWAELVAGRPRPGITRWATAVRAARGMDVAAVWAAHVGAGVAVTVLGQQGYPPVLAEDPEAPAVLFSIGDLAALDGRSRVAIVGTRSATRYGLGVAAQLGADLAAAGVVVVSGLALGIDGAAHEGALAAWRVERDDQSAGPASGGSGPLSRHVPCRAAPPVAVVAGSVATPYPRQHAGLWRRVSQAGAVLSEAPLDSVDLGWRFPQRNRIMAAIADVVVVVECHPSGGSMHTVQAAAQRGVPVGAVPGSVRSPASAGTNALLADGCFVVRDASDVLVAVGLATASAPAPPGRGPTRSPMVGWVAASISASSAEARSGPGAMAEADGEAEAGRRGAGRDTRRDAVLEALGWERCSVDQLLRRTGMELDELSLALERLRDDGLVEGAGGAWERTSADPRNLSPP